MHARAVVVSLAAAALAGLAAEARADLVTAQSVHEPDIEVHTDDVVTRTRAARPEGAQSSCPRRFSLKRT